MNRILVTGASGLLGLNFCRIFCEKYELFGVCNHTRLHQVPFQTVECDLIKEDPGELLDSVKPQIILHCAAMANIDQCERNPEEAEKINSIYPGELAAAARKRGAKFVHISTDAVFDGEDCGPYGYTEESAANPISRYALTKLMGERNVLDSNPDALVSRVNFYGWSMNGSRSLVEFFYNNLSEGKCVNGFSDVYFCTLYVRSLAALLDEMIELDAKGIYHVFSRNFQSKYDFGVSIANKFGFDPNLIHPVSWKEGGLTAKRSPNLVMNTDKLRKFLGHDMPDQQEDLNAFFAKAKAGEREQIRSHKALDITER